jgi:hypothetical protein
MELLNSTVQTISETLTTENISNAINSTVSNCVEFTGFSNCGIFGGTRPGDNSTNSHCQEMWDKNNTACNIEFGITLAGVAVALGITACCIKKFYDHTRLPDWSLSAFFLGSCSKAERERQAAHKRENARDDVEMHGRQ